MKQKQIFIWGILGSFILLGSGSTELDIIDASKVGMAPEKITNSLKMDLVRIDPGTFSMGSEAGEYDEKPVHQVTISTPFYLSTTPVTNSQYEMFDPGHRALRGYQGFSREDGEAVVFVDWQNAVDFTRWLSEREGKPYRLATEAEWEYACRAGTTTEFSTGNELPKIFHRAQRPQIPGRSQPSDIRVPVSLAVGKSPANPWGLHDMHGLVEEWCLDWYGPYVGGTQTDPVGYSDGPTKVTRGGSHNTFVSALRSAKRLGTLPEDKHEMIGFRVMQCAMPTGTLRQPDQPRWAENVDQRKCDWKNASESDTPFFKGPIPYIRPDGKILMPHNHVPALTWCDNGDLLAIWISTRAEEGGREMILMSSRLKAGTNDWTTADVFFAGPGRSLIGSALINDGNGALHWFNGLGSAQKNLMNQALISAHSTDNGVTWSHPNFINPHRKDSLTINQPVASVTQLRDGTMVLPNDAHGGRRVDFPGGAGTALWFRNAHTKEWSISAGTISGVHAGVVELQNGDLLALARATYKRPPRRMSRHDRMPMSISSDRGRTWQYRWSELPAITGSQRHALIRLREGPLLLLSFTNPFINGDSLKTGMIFRNSNGEEYRGYGLYGALSFDEGKSWPVRKLLTPGKGNFKGWGGTGEFSSDAVNAEPGGYLSAVQSPDNVIHVISSGLYYQFNSAWLEQPSPSP